jgi:hypothetical protein
VVNRQIDSRRRRHRVRVIVRERRVNLPRTAW